MTKTRISVSIDGKTRLKLFEKIRENRKYRNQSHLIEEAILTFLEKGAEKWPLLNYLIPKEMNICY